MIPFKKILCLILTVCIIIMLPSCKKDKETPEDQLIYYYIDNEPVTLDPQIANDAGARLIIMNTFEGLIRIDGHNNIVEGAAESWEISADKMMYTFHLRNGLKWNDGTTLTASDFIYGIQRALMPETASPTARMLYCVKNAEKVHLGEKELSSLGIFAKGNDTIIFQLEYPDSDFLQVLSMPPAMPCHREFFEKTAGQYGRDADKLLCNGAFYIRKNGWQHDEYIYLRKNDEYTGADTPVPAGVNFTIGNTPDSMFSAIESGAADCGAITSADIDKAQSLGFHLTGFGDTVVGISFNTTDELLQNKKIRCALLSALDRSFILQKIPDHCIATENFIPDSATLDGKSYRQLAGNVTFASEKAPTILLNQGMKELSVNAVTNITILCTDDDKTQNLVNNIIETWNRLTGGYFNKKPVPLSELKDRIASGRYEAVIAPLMIEGNSPLNALEAFSSSSKYNPASYSSEEYEEVLNQIRKNLTATEVEKIRNAESFLLNNGLFYPLYIENRYYASAANVTRIIFHPYGAEADFFYATKLPET